MSSVNEVQTYTLEELEALPATYRIAVPRDGDVFIQRKVVDRLIATCRAFMIGSAVLAERVRTPQKFRQETHHPQCASVLDPKRSCDCYHGAASRETAGPTDTEVERALTSWFTQGGAVGDASVLPDEVVAENRRAMRRILTDFLASRSGETGGRALEGDLAPRAAQQPTRNDAMRRRPTTPGATAAHAWGVASKDGRLVGPGTIAAWSRREDAEWYMRTECTGNTGTPFRVVPLVPAPFPAPAHDDTARLDALERWTRDRDESCLTFGDLDDGEPGFTVVDNTRITDFGQGKTLRAAIDAAMGEQLRAEGTPKDHPAAAPSPASDTRGDGAPDGADVQRRFDAIWKAAVEFAEKKSARDHIAETSTSQAQEDFHERELNSAAASLEASILDVLRSANGATPENTPTAAASSPVGDRDADVRALALQLIEATGGDPDAAKSAVAYAWPRALRHLRDKTFTPHVTGDGRGGPDE